MEGECLSCGVKFEQHDTISRTCAKLQQARRSLREVHSLLASVDTRFRFPSVKRSRELAEKALAETV